MRGVSWRKPLQLLLVVYFVALIGCEAGSAGSGSGCSNEYIGSDRLPFSIPSHNLTGRMFINPANQACATSGCVTGWRYCYAAKETVKETSIVPVTFGLWQNCANGFRMVDNSSYSTTITLSPNQLFSCEVEQLDERCWAPVREEDAAVGVVLDADAPLHVVGELEEGSVMEGAGPMEGECVTMKERSGYTLLVTALVGDCREAMDEGCPAQPTPSDESSETSVLGLRLWALGVFCFLGVVIIVLLVVLSVICGKRCCSYKKSSLSSNGLLSDTIGRYSTNTATTALSSGSSAVDFEMHVLNTNSPESVHCTSLSPTPTISQGTQLDGPSRTVTSPQQEDQVMSSPPPPTAPSTLSSTKRKPPVKPKPFHLLSQKAVTHPQSASHEAIQAAPPLNSVPSMEVAAVNDSCSGTVRRPQYLSYSEDALETDPLEKAEVPESPRHGGMMNRVSAGSLPDFFPYSPIKDEDDYALPTPPFYQPSSTDARRLVRPQPYLKFQPIYSYAYAHVTRTAVTGPSLTVPRNTGPAEVAVKQRSRSETTYPCEAISDPHLQLPNREHCDNITTESGGSSRQEGGDGARKSPSLTRPHSAQPCSPPGHWGMKRSAHSSLLAGGHPPTSWQPPLDAFLEDSPSQSTEGEEHPQPPTADLESSLLESIGSEGYMNENEYPHPRGPTAEPECPLLQSTESEGYMNDGEYPQPPPAGSPLSTVSTRKPHYTALQPVEEKDSTYTALKSTSNSGDDADFLEISTNYDHLSTP